jgi:hypothetical protein
MSNCLSDFFVSMIFFDEEAADALQEFSCKLNDKFLLIFAIFFALISKGISIGLFKIKKIILYFFKLTNDVLSYA